jgi:uncharacterized protein YqeY
MLEEKIFEDFKQAMKDKDKLRSSILSFVRAQFKNAQIEKRKDKLDDTEVITILKKEVKRHEEAIEQFKKGNREDLVKKESDELVIIKTYLPASLSDEELKDLVNQALVEFPQATIKDMGNIMKRVLEKSAGRADGSKVSLLVKEALTKAK